LKGIIRMNGKEEIKRGERARKKEKPWVVE